MVAIAIALLRSPDPDFSGAAVVDIHSVASIPVTPTLVPGVLSSEISRADPKIVTLVAPVETVFVLNILVSLLSKVNADEIVTANMANVNFKLA